MHTEAAPKTHKAAAQLIPDPKTLLYRKKNTVEKKEAAAAAPVETGSLSDSATKHKSHKSAEVAPIKQTSSGAGYPTPMPPADGDAAQNRASTTPAHRSRRGEIRPRREFRRASGR